ncbi:MAG: hypothetical protein AB7I19_15820 [Planctomycetota bacterium]
MNSKSRLRDQQAPPRATSNFFRQSTESAAPSDAPLDGGQSWLVDEPAYDEPQDQLVDDIVEAAEGVDENYPAAAVTTAAPTRSHARTRGESPPPSGSPFRVLGIALLVVGVGVGVATLLAPPAVGGALDVLGRLGVHPGTLVVLGLALFGAGSAQLRLERRLHAGKDTEAQSREWFESMLQQIPSGQGTTSFDAQPLHLEFQRLDEKIANLTRATKLYGTPLLEISNQVSDVATRLNDTAEIATKVAELQSAFENTERLEAKDLDPLAQTIQSTRELMTEATKQQRRLQESLDEVQDAIVTAIRSGQDELRRAIADGSAHVQREVERQATLGASAPAVDLGSIEDALSRIQREVQSLATSISRIEARPATAMAPQAALASPAPSAPATTTASAAPTNSAPPDGLAERIAGTTQSKNKNVLGAIAKLRSMRS